MCVIMSNVTARKASCVINIGIWNDALLFLLVSGISGSSSVIICFRCVCVGVGVWIASNVCSSSTIVGEVSAFMRCRLG